MKKSPWALLPLLLLLLVCASGALAQDIQPVGKAVGKDAQGNVIRQARVGGIDMGYKLMGNGEPLVLIPGLGMTMDRWPQAVLEAFGKKRQLIVLDNRGMGHSTADGTPFSYPLFAADVIGLMDALGVKRADVLGFSMGSTITQQLLLSHPDRFNKAIIHATTTDGGPVADGLRKRTYTDPIILRQLAASATWKTPLDKLPAIPNQTLLLVGTADPVVGSESSKVIASAIPGAWLVQIKNASHGLILEAPEQFTKIVLTFLDVDATVKPRN